MAQQPDESRPTRVLYELTIIGGKLSADEAIAANQLEQSNRAIWGLGGVSTAPWQYQFETFEAAQGFAHKLRQTGIAWEEIRIRAINDRTGGGLVS